MTDIVAHDQNASDRVGRSPSSSLSTLWAKTPNVSSHGSGSAPSERIWLSLSQHSRDASDVGVALVRDWLADSVRTRLQSSLGRDGDPGSVERLLGWLAGTHDVGKAEVIFQAQAARTSASRFLWERVAALPETHGIECDVHYKAPHSYYSELIIRRWLKRRFPDIDPIAAASVAVIAGAHHGVPSGIPWQNLNRFTHDRAEKESWLDLHGDQWADLWWELLDDIGERTSVAQDLERLLQAGGITVSDQVFLAGFVSMADWIASNQELFPLTTSGMHDSPRSRAGVALQRLGLTRPWKPALIADLDFRQRCGWESDWDLRPVQRESIRIAALGEGPTLMIIEEETGAGKTEAAQLAGEVIASRTGAGGMAFALPTMTTTDAMLPRMIGWINRLSDTSAHSIRLMHSKAQLNEAFDELVRATASVDEEPSTVPGLEGKGHESVIAHAWFSGRKGVLSEFLACTVDQVLMAALATRYVTLRHLGLAGKVVVVDEVHSYDVYSSDYLARAMTWLAAQGASVILLSATLAQAPRQRLVTAYEEGLRADNQAASYGVEKPHGRVSLRAQAALRKTTQERQSHCVVPHVPYPRITMLSKSGLTVNHVPSRPGCRHVAVSTIGNSETELVSEVARLTGNGGVVGVICNTVSRAQCAARALEKVYPGDVDLFHSQFTAADRARKELELTKILGVHSNVADRSRPHFRIVVGTQVLEQSLDVDFDVLVTDLAPTDSLAQRAGRLHRHQRGRPEGLESAHMVLRGINVADDPVPTFERGSELIYGARVLLATAAIFRPYVMGRPWCARHDVADDVEATYAETCLMPPAWHESYIRAQAEEERSRHDAAARAATFQVCAPAASRGRMPEALGAMLATDGDTNEAVALASVRDIDPTLEVALIHHRGERLYPLPWLIEREFESPLTRASLPASRIIHVIADSVVRLPRRLVRPDQIPDAIAELDNGGFHLWQRDYRLKGTPILVLDEQLSGTILGKGFRYDRELGVVPQSKQSPMSASEGGQDVYHPSDT